MKLLVAAVALLCDVAQSYHQSCIKQEGAIGAAEGTQVSDFELLDLQATKDMRLRSLKICVDRRDNLRGLQINLEDPNTLDRLALSPIGDTDTSSSGKCLELSLSTPIEVLELSQSKSVVDSLRLTKEGRSKEYGNIGGDIFKLEFSEE